MDLELSGKKALVCGSTDGIGKAAAIELAALGADIVLVARNEEKLKSMVELLTIDEEQNHDYIVADFNEPEVLRDLVSQYVGSHGNIQILVNNTGGPPAGPLLDADVSEFDDAIRMHLKCSHYLVQVLAEGMKQSHYGRIINIISTSVKNPIQGLGVSNTVRGAMASWSKTLAGELGKHGITVNNVLPGFTMTGRLEGLIEKKANKRGTAEEVIEKEMINSIPLARFADPEEVANGVAFLATPAAGYINGINLPVDGGRLGCL